jgi:hypothetical protein
VVGRGEEGCGDTGAVPGLLAVATHQFPANILYRRGLVLIISYQFNKIGTWHYNCLK